MIRDERDPFREPTDEELATLDRPDDLFADDELMALDRLDALDPELDGDEIDALLLDADADVHDKEIVVMPGPDPRQVIRDYLGPPSVFISDTPDPRGSGWHGGPSRGGMGADVTTMRFLKARGILRRQVHAVVFDTAEGRRMRFTCYLVQDDAGDWRFDGGAGGSADGAPVRADPSVNLGAGGWPASFYAGGAVVDNGVDVARVRLIAANGTIMEDTVDAGVVLFITDQLVERPIHVELYNQAGQMVAQHGAFERKPR